MWDPRGGGGGEKRHIWFDQYFGIGGGLDSKLDR